MQTETMKQTAKLVQMQRNDFRADEIMAVLDADPTLDADGVIAALDEARAEACEHTATRAGGRTCANCGTKL